LTTLVSAAMHGMSATASRNGKRLGSM
jgi:hypothetical protein